MNNKIATVFALTLVLITLTSCTLTKQKEIKPTTIINTWSVNIGQSISVPQANGIQTMTGSSNRK